MAACATALFSHGLGLWKLENLPYAGVDNYSLSMEAMGVFQK